MHLVVRAFVLYCASYALAYVILSLSISRNIAQVKDLNVMALPSWYTLSVGGTGASIGLLMPHLDHIYHVRPFKDWATVFRSLICYLGILLACVKFPNQDSLALTMSIGTMVGFLWYIGDRTLMGLAFASTATTIGTFVAQYTSFAGLFKWTDPDLFFVRSWIIPLLFGSCVLFGLLGRALHASK
eukprot:m.18421 g.18421  ORF g.18421 m.18421 type:complete len:185 (-) comp10806_c0_seq3:191-745(-)